MGVAPGEGRLRTDGTRHIDALDGLRGVAALTVFVYHVETFLPIPGDRIVVGGFLGVDLFFALSGYLITWNLLAHQERSGHLGILSYGAKRAARLLPLLAVYLTMSALYELSIGATGTDVAWSSFETGFFVPGILLGSADFTQTLTTGHLWSLAVEVHFYVLIPVLVATVLHRRAPDWVAGTALLIILVTAAIYRRQLLDAGTTSVDIYTRSTARLDTLFLGALAAVLHRRRALVPHAWATAGWASFGILTIWALTLEPFSHWLPQGGFTAIGIPATVLVLATALGAGPAHLFERGPLPAIGRVSYGVYLWHILAIFAVAEWLGGTPWPIQVATATALTACLTLLSWRHVEQPVLQRLRARLAGPGILGRSERAVPPGGVQPAQA